jgi:hypothetical protein
MMTRGLSAALLLISIGHLSAASCMSGRGVEPFHGVWRGDEASSL